MWSLHRRAAPALAPLAVAALLAGPARAQPITYTVMDLGALAGGTASRGFAINAPGQVTGRAATTGDPSYPVRAFRTTPGGRIGDPGADLGVLPGGTFSTGYGINATGQVTGYADDATGQQRAFRTSATGKVSDPGTDLGTLGTYSLGYGINTSGQVTGYSYSSTAGGTRAFRTTATGRVSDPGTDLGTLGGQDSRGYAINASGQVTGIAYIPPPAFTYHAFRTTATGRISDPGTDLGTLGGVASEGLAINDSGQVTGDANLTGDAAHHAFRTTATGKISDPGTDLGTLGGANSQGNAINALGVVVGTSDITGGGQHAFLFDAQMRDLNALIPPGTGWALTSATGINDSGWITGWGTVNGQEHAFLLTPVGVPEPCSLVLTGAALAGGWVLRRRRVPAAG